MTKKMHPERKRMTGLTLVELMVAMAVGLLLLFAVVSLYLANKTSFRHQESNARIQEDGRFALESIAYDLRNASYTGCSVVSTHANVVNGFSTNWPLDSRNMLRGFNGTTGYPTDISTTGAQGDALVVLYRDNESEMVVLSHNAAASEFKLGALHTFKKGEVLHVTDCRRDTVFQMSGPDASDSDIVKHEVGALDPNNCRVDLGSSCDEAANSYTFAAGALISRLVSKAYYIAPASNGAGNSLYVKSLAGSTNGQALTFELLPNVQAMRLRYGLDLNCDGFADRFATADEVNAAPKCSADMPSPWQMVVSAKIELLVLGQEPNVTSDNQKFCLDYKGSGDPATCDAANYGYVYTETQRRSGKVFSTTVALRNRMS